MQPAAKMLAMPMPPGRKETHLKEGKKEREGEEKRGTEIKRSHEKETKVPYRHLFLISSSPSK